MQHPNPANTIQTFDFRTITAQKKHLKSYFFLGGFAPEPPLTHNLSPCLRQGDAAYADSPPKSSNLLKIPPFRDLGELDLAICPYRILLNRGIGSEVEHGAQDEEKFDVRSVCTVFLSVEFLSKNI